MTPILRHIYGCGIWIITKDIQINFNISRKKIVTILQQKSFGIHTCNSAYINTSAAHYKKKVFPDGDCLHATFKYVYHFISYNPTKPKNIICIEFFFVMSFLSENITDK